MLYKEKEFIGKKDTRYLLRSPHPEEAEKVIASEFKKRLYRKEDSDTLFRYQNEK